MNLARVKYAIFFFTIWRLIALFQGALGRRVIFKITTFTQDNRSIPSLNYFSFFYMYELFILPFASLMFI